MTAFLLGLARPASPALGARPRLAAFSVVLAPPSVFYHSAAAQRSNVTGWRLRILVSETEVGQQRGKK